MVDGGRERTIVEEMPTINTLLQRKKLGVAKPAAVAPEQPAAPLPPPESAAGAEGGPALELATTTTVAGAIEATSQIATGQAQAAPVARRRPANVVSADSTQPVRMLGTRTLMGAKGQPPAFNGTLILERLDLKAFQKMLKKHKKSPDMKKLDCLGYFSGGFAEIAYFEVTQPGSLAGVLGFGNPQLVSAIRGRVITAQLLPTIFEVLSIGEVFVGPSEGLRPEDLAGFVEMGFQATGFVGAFPMMRKKAVAGLWLCAGPVAQEIPPDEIKALGKILTGLQF